MLPPKQNSLTGQIPLGEPLIDAVFVLVLVEALVGVGSAHTGAEGGVVVHGGILGGSWVMIFDGKG